MVGRNRVAILMAEFLGTGILALVMLGVQHSTIGLPYFIALAAGLTLVLATMVFGKTGSGHFNPAVTIGMWTARQIKTLPALGYIIAQMLGAWATYYLYTYFVKTSLPAIGGHYDGRVLVAEAVGGFVLSVAFAAVVFNRFRNAKAAAAVGLGYVLAILIAASPVVAGGNGIGIVNPAVALSMRAFDVFGSMGWGTYALGPVLGAIIGFNLYALLFAPEDTLLRIRAMMGERSSRKTATAPVTVVETVTEEVIADDDEDEEPVVETESAPAEKSVNTKHNNKKSHKGKKK